MKLPKGLTVDRIIRAAKRDEYAGFCIECGHKQYECEGDAREYECEVCGENKVYGAEELVLMTVF